MNAKDRPRAVALLLLALLASGCGLFGEKTTVVEGVVVDALTQRPLSNIGVALATGGAGGGTNYDGLGATDAEGRFRLETESSAGGWRVQVNIRHEAPIYGVTLPYSPVHQATSVGPVRYGKTTRFRVELRPGEP